MAYTILYSFTQGGNLYNVRYDQDNPSDINYYNAGTYSGTINPPTAGTQVGAPYCQGTDKYTYTAKSSIPYANYTLQPNSSYCGYVPPSCDIAINDFTVNDETDIGANNGSVNMFAVSSLGGIIYYLFNSSLSVNLSNTTGYFPNLPPDTYSVKAVDSNGCDAVRTAIVKAFDNTLTHFKYRLQTTSPDGSIAWELRLLDLFNNYPVANYPIDVDGTGTPLVYAKKIDGEDKNTPFAISSLDIALLYDGTFQTSEFNTAPERKWKAELYKDGVLEFQGWLLPDEVKDYYEDAPYYYTLKATDGIPSLKGNSWGNGSGGKGYGLSQVPQYGLTRYMQLIRQCLDQLGYNYGDLIVASSLRYNNTYNSNLWREMGTWSDILYQTDGDPISTYDALELLVRGMKCCLFQHGNKFVLANWNDLSYLDNGLKVDEYNKSFYELDLYFSPTGTINQIGIGTQVERPKLQMIGYDKTILPINPIQNANYDKAYNIKGKSDFDLLALLYPNPSFEIGAVEGSLPLNIVKIGENLTAGAHYLADAYDGDWALRLQWVKQNSLQYVKFTGDGYFIDQPNKKANISIFWREGNHPSLPAGDNITVAYRLIFKNAATGNIYIFVPGTFDDATPRWIAYTPSFFSSVNTVVTDYLQWNNFTQTTTVFPEDGIGYLNVWLNAPVNVNPNGDSTGLGQMMIIDYDEFTLSLSDANDQYSKQISEVHNVYAITGVPQANVKEVDLPLFTYPNNRRIAGNVFTKTPYADGEVENKWNYALHSNDPMDRLGAAHSRAIARNYRLQYPMWEGEYQANYVQFYGQFRINYYDGKLFMPFSIEQDLRNGTGKIVLVENTDIDIQSEYTYKANFEKSARKNTN